MIRLSMDTCAGSYGVGDTRQDSHRAYDGEW